MIDRKNEIIAVAWQYLLTTGWEQASIEEFCRKAALDPNCLDRLFDSFDDIWIQVGKYGLSKIVDGILHCALHKTDATKNGFDALLRETQTHKNELRTAIQLATSPVLNQKMRDISKDFRLFYNQYANKLMAEYECSRSAAETFIFYIITFIIDYAIWDDKEKTQMLLENLYNRTIHRL